MNPIETIEKWINEHASAAVLGQHLALIKDQLAIAERSKKEAEVRADSAEATVKQLTVSLDECRAEIKKRDAKPKPPPQITIRHGGGGFPNIT
jgi:hypothetical protein